MSSYAPQSALDMDEDAEATPAPTMPCLHVIFHAPPRAPTLPPTPVDDSSVRTGLLAHLASHLLGDADAAEWLLLHLISRMCVADLAACIDLAVTTGELVCVSARSRSISASRRPRRRRSTSVQSSNRSCRPSSARRSRSSRSTR